MNTFNVQLANERVADLRRAAENDRLIRSCASRLREQRRELRRQRRKERRDAAPSWAWDLPPITTPVIWWG